MGSLLNEQIPQDNLGKQILDIENSHHVFTRESFARIFKIISALNDIGQIVPESVFRCIEELREDLLPHLMKEERILFPYITALEKDPLNPPQSCFGSITNPINMMRIEHARVKELLDQLKVLTSNYMVTNEVMLEGLYAELKKLDQDLQEHILWEDEVIFPEALKLVTPA